MIQAVGVVLFLLLLSTKLPRIVAAVLWMVLAVLVINRWDQLQGLFKPKG